MAEKKYYWLKLSDDFFDDDTIQYIEEQDNGVAYSNFYLKLCLKSLRSDGKLIRFIGDQLIPYDVKSLSKLTGVDVDTVRSAMYLFEQIGLVKRLETGEIFLAQIDEMIGSETDKAKLMRKKRALDKATGNNVTELSNNVTQALPNCYTEKEIDIDKEIESEKDVDKDIYIPYREVIDYLNSKAGTSYKCSTKKTQTLIHARFNEGFTLDDFKKVIDIKCSEWMNTTMNQYLRPETLFGPKFEGYLNQKPKPMTNAQVMDAIIRGEMVINESEGSNGSYQSNPIGVSYEN